MAFRVTMRNTPVDEMFEVKFVDAEIPGKARIFNSSSVFHMR